MSAISIRTGNANDVDSIYRMLRDSAIDQGGESELCVTPENLREDGFTREPPRFYSLIAERDGQPAGLALYFLIYSTWNSLSSVYLEDLYVTPALRRLGVANALMAGLAHIAAANGCAQMRWLVLSENARAIQFYESIGAELNDPVIAARIAGEALTRLRSSNRPARGLPR